MHPCISWWRSATVLAARQPAGHRIREQESTDAHSHVRLATVTTPVAQRCVVHPGRAAVEECPRCGRARCAEDVASYGDRGCGVCLTAEVPRRPPSSLEIAVGAGLASLPAAFLGGWVASQYVDTHIFAL